MKQIKIKNLDELYSTIKSEMGKLVAEGYDCNPKYHNYATQINGANTLLQWFFNHIGFLKEGISELNIATAMGEGSYTVYQDELCISTTPTPLGLLVVLKRLAHNYSYNSREQQGETDEVMHKQIFLLEFS